MKMIDLNNRTVQFYLGEERYQADQVSRIEVKDGILFIWRRPDEGAESLHWVVRDWNSLMVLS